MWNHPVWLYRGQETAGFHDIPHLALGFGRGIFCRGTMDEKHSEFLKVWMPEHLKRALQDLADLDERKTSEYVCGVLMDHVYGHQRKLCEVPTEGANRPGSGRRGP